MSLEGNAMDLLQKGFRVTLGATASLVESLQDPLKREENLDQLRRSPTEFTEQLAEKGAEAEGEARRFVDSVVTQYRGGTTPSGSTASTPTAAPVIDPELERELRALTVQLAEFRSQLR